MMILKVSDNNSTMYYLDKNQEYKDVLQIDTDDLWYLINQVYDNTKALPLEDDLNIKDIKNNVSRIISDKLFEKLRIFASEAERFKITLNDIYDGDLQSLDSL